MCACGLSKEEKEAAEIPPEPKITRWLAEEKFVTIQPVRTVEGLEKKFVLIRGLTTRRVYSVEVQTCSENQEIPVGSQVEVSRISWWRTSAQNPGSDSGHLIITEVLSVL